MNKTLKILALGLAISLLTACGEPKLDTSSDEAMKASLQEIMAELSQEEQEKFKKTIVGIYMLAAMASLGNDITADEAKSKINERLNGKTAKEVFIMADEIKAKMKNKE
jgi:hypothetical protein